VVALVCLWRSGRWSLFDVPLTLAFHSSLLCKFKADIGNDLVRNISHGLTRRRFCSRIVSKFDLDGSSANFALIANALKGQIVDSMKDASATVVDAVINAMKEANGIMSHAMCAPIRTQQVLIR